MRNRIFLILVVLLLLLSCSGSKQSKLIGVWTVDYAETFKTIKGKEVWEGMGEMEKELFPDILEEMINSMRITIDAGNMIMEMGNSKVNVAYEIDIVEGNKIITNTRVEDEDVKLTFKFIGNDLMMFTSDATDDMDFYVWKRELIHKV